MGLKDKTKNYILFSETTKRIRNWGIVAKLWSFVRPMIDFSSIFETLNDFFIYA